VAGCVAVLVEEEEAPWLLNQGVLVGLLVQWVPELPELGLGLLNQLAEVLLGGLELLPELVEGLLKWLEPAG